MVRFAVLAQCLCQFAASGKRALKAPRTSSILQDVFQCTAWLVNGRGLLVADDDRIGGEREACFR